MEKYSRGNIINSCDTTTGNMGIEGLPGCSQKNKKGLECSTSIGQCTVQRIDWIIRYLTKEDDFTRGQNPTEAEAIIAVNRRQIKGILAETGCNLLDKVLQRREEITRQQPLQKTTSSTLIRY